MAETSAEPTAEAASEEPAAAEASQADVTEASAEPVDAEVAPQEETVAEITSEAATVTLAEDGEGAAESAGMTAVDEASPANAKTPSEAAEPEATHAAEVAA